MDNKFLIKDGNSASWEMPDGIPYIEKTFDYWGEQTVYAKEGRDEKLKVGFLDENEDVRYLTEGKKYLVIFDGQEYECICRRPTGGIYNNYIAPNKGGYCTNGSDYSEHNPFVYKTNDQGVPPSSSYGKKFILQVHAPGAHTISITEINEEIKPIDIRCLPPASTTSLGAVKQAASVPDGSDINTLLAALREAGIIAPLEQST